jgi:hypothetical protein
MKTLSDYYPSSIAQKRCVDGVNTETYDTLRVFQESTES